MCGDRENCSCISEILNKILLLQKKNCCEEGFTGCDKPFLGPITNSACYNTRPVQLFNCCTGTPWTFTVETNGSTFTSDTFRVESIDDCCVTCRLLYNTPGSTELTGCDRFVTIDLRCCGAVRCLDDVYIETC